VSVRASLSLGCEEAPLGGVSEDYLTELTMESAKTVRQSPPLPSCQPGTEFASNCRRRFGGALPGVGALFLLHRWCCARWCLSTPPRRTAWAHGAGSAPGRRRVSWRAGRCRGAPGPTELSAPRPVALATTSITGSLFFGGKKRFHGRALHAGAGGPGGWPPGARLQSPCAELTGRGVFRHHQDEQLQLLFPCLRRLHAARHGV